MLATLLVWWEWLPLLSCVNEFVFSCFVDNCRCLQLQPCEIKSDAPCPSNFISSKSHCDLSVAHWRNNRAIVGDAQEMRESAPSLILYRLGLHPDDTIPSQIGALLLRR